MDYITIYINHLEVLSLKMPKDINNFMIKLESLFERSFLLGFTSTLYKVKDKIKKEGNNFHLLYDISSDDLKSLRKAIETYKDILETA